MLPKLKHQLKKIFQLELLIVLLGAVFLEVVFLVMVMSTISVPDNAVLDSGLQEVLRVFEG